MWPASCVGGAQWCSKLVSRGAHEEFSIWLRALACMQSAAPASNVMATIAPSLRCYYATAKRTNCLNATSWTLSQATIVDPCSAIVGWDALLTISRRTLVPARGSEFAPSERQVDVEPT